MATLNGMHSLPAGSDTTLSAETDDAMTCLTLELHRDSETVWVSEPLSIGPEPTYIQSTSNSADYLALVWQEAGAVAVLGDSAVILVALSSGRVLGSFSLEFTGKESLEQAHLALTEGREYLVVTSTKRVWLVDHQLQPALVYEPRFILAGLPRFARGRLTVEEYDFDSDQEIVTQVIEL